MGHRVGGRWFGHVHLFAHPLVALVVLALLVAVVGAVVLLVLRDRAGRAIRAAAPSRDVAVPSTAESILDERFARGEIDDDEYQRRRTLLRAAP